MGIWKGWFERLARPGRPVFIHVSKNAGSSISQTAWGHITLAGHQTAARWLRRHRSSGPLFAVVRNPFDRVVSEYAFRRRRFEAGKPGRHLANLYKSFEDWTLSTFRDGEMARQDYFERNDIPYRRARMVGGTLLWFLPQVGWLGDEEGRILVDELLRFESLDEDWARFSRKHGLPSRLVRTNVAPRERDYRRYYSDQTRELVATHYRQDLKTFGYAF